MVGNLPGFVYRCKNDKDWTMLYISEGCKSVTGYAPGDFLNNNKITYNSIICEEYRPLLFEESKIAYSKKSFFQYEYQIITASNEIRWVWERGTHIFADDIPPELFRQVDDSTRRKYEGAGLGLAITRAYVEMLGGKIWVESRLKQGAVFYFILPSNTSEKNQEPQSRLKEVVESQGT